MARYPTLTQVGITNRENIMNFVFELNIVLVRNFHKSYLIHNYIIMIIVIINMTNITILNSNNYMLN